MYFWREREKILDIFEKVTGGRVHHAYNKLGSVRYDLSAGDDAFILGKLASVEKKTRDYLEEIRTERIIRARLSGVGTITKEEAKRWSLVGPVARGSGVENDVREYAPYEAYDCVDFGQVVADDGDAMARATVRLGEILQSCDIARQVLGQVKDKKMPKLCAIPEIKDGEGFGRVEAPRGENFHFYRITGGRIERAKVRTPTLANIFIVEKLLEGCEVGDVPVMISSLDPCFGCMDRVMVVRGEACSVLREKEFRRKFGCSP
jgi:Ni,Fe-hydrogenase III large subunit